jgi:hypothetical protein
MDEPFLNLPTHDFTEATYNRKPIPDPGKRQHQIRIDEPDLELLHD